MCTDGRMPGMSGPELAEGVAKPSGRVSHNGLYTSDRMPECRFEPDHSHRSCLMSEQKDHKLA